MAVDVMILRATQQAFAPPGILCVPPAERGLADPDPPDRVRHRQAPPCNAST